MIAAPPPLQPRMVAVKALGSAKPVSLQRMRSGDEAGCGLRDSHRDIALIREAKTRLPLGLAMIDALVLVDELRIDQLAVPSPVRGRDLIAQWPRPARLRTRLIPLFGFDVMNRSFVPIRPPYPFAQVDERHRWPKER